MISLRNTKTASSSFVSSKRKSKFSILRIILMLLFLLAMIFFVIPWALKKIKGMFKKKPVTQASPVETASQRANLTPAV